MLRGTTYGKKKPEPIISGTNRDASNSTMIALRHESSGKAALEIRISVARALCQLFEKRRSNRVPAFEPYHLIRDPELLQFRLLTVNALRIRKFVVVTESHRQRSARGQIGRASCRERVQT